MEPHEWNAAYLQPAALDLYVIQGISAIKEFLYAVKERIAPEWARREVHQVLR